MIEKTKIIAEMIIMMIKTTIIIAMIVIRVISSVMRRCDGDEFVSGSWGALL